MRCNCCNTVHTKDSFCDANRRAITNAIKATFYIDNYTGNLMRVLKNGDVKQVREANLYTLTGGRRVTHNMLLRVLNNEPLYNKKNSAR